MIQKTHLTIAEAATLVKRTPSHLYRVIAQGKLKARETTDGLQVATVDVLNVFANRRRGRPRNTPRPPT